MSRTLRLVLTALVGVLVAGCFIPVPVHGSDGGGDRGSYRDHDQYQDRDREGGRDREGDRDHGRDHGRGQQWH
jgi:hypothetical protein